MKFRYILHIRLLLFLAALCSNTIAFAQKAITINSIKNAGVITLASAAEWQKTLLNARISEPVQVVIKFTRPLSSSELDQLKKSITVNSYLPDNTYTAYLNSPLPLTLATDAYLVEINPEWKADAYTWNQSTSKSVNLIVSFDKTLSKEKIKERVGMLGGALIRDEPIFSGTYTLALPSKNLKLLASWYAVEYISPISKSEPLDIESQYSAKANLVSAPAIFGGFGLTGKGVVVGVGDNVSGDFHTDLKDRIINYNPVGYTNHGVHINGIVGGAGIIDHKGEGIAPAATLVDHLYDNVWAQLPEMHETYNMTLTNNSYASLVGDCSYAGTYDIYSQRLDQLALDYPDVLQVFAAGNDGYLKCSPYPDGFGTVNGGFQPAKNTIVVTSTSKKFVNAIDGSRGPIKDGRLKPEMTAVGVDVNSTTRNEQYLVAGGTSMACPEVTGALALMTERYKQIHANANPRNDVLKCLVLNGTMDIGNPGPDYRFGYGFLNLYRSLAMLNNTQYYVDSTANTQEQTDTITVPANTAQLKVMLCWNDIPANPMSASQLINDLDLEVATPNAQTHLPLILDPTPANVLNDAIEGVDRRNNSEQAIINNPVAGVYTVKTKGFSIPSGKQAYVVSYDIIPVGVMLGFPNSGAQVKANDSIHVYWDASDNTNSFTLEFSNDGGGQWNTLDNNIPSDQRYYIWHIADGINSAQSQMRLTRNNTDQTFTSGNFVVSQQPELSLDTVQCPGYMRIEWQPIPNASEYEIMRKVGPAMKSIDTVSATEYTLAGLSPDSIYYMAVRPIIDGFGGYRSLAIKRQPNDGSCKGNISNGDLRAEVIVSSLGGRKFTTSELSANEKVSLTIRNLDDVPVNYYRVSYSLNGGAWQSFVSNAPIPALGKIGFDLGTFNMSAAGSYTINAAISNLLSPDPIHSNDTTVKTIRQLNNDPISVNAAFVEDFETMPEILRTKDTLGITPNDHWDYYNDSDSGRIRSFINTGLTIGGQRSISMDAVRASSRTQNELIGTFNLNSYNSKVDEIRMEFNYRMHGVPDSINGNSVWVRGSDTSKWSKLFTYSDRTTDVGNIINSGTLSITDALLDSNQNFTTSFQVKFGQRDSTLIAATNYGCGLTVDDIKLYTVKNDVQLNAVLTPGIIECGLNEKSPLTVSIYNSDNHAQQNVSIYYRLDGGEVVNEVIGNIAGKQKTQYTFNNNPDLSRAGKHVIDIWLNAEGDTYRKNDSILNYSFYNQPLISALPYKEDFESGDGSWFSEGVNDSWEWGIPASPKINKAASGSKAWKTNLDGKYNDNEISYLYSPCIDLSHTLNPELNLQIALDIENCGQVLCDGAYVEYCTDGISWQHLGESGKGINWYSDTLYNIWSQQGNTNWHPASYALPKVKSIIKLRFSFFSDIAGNFEGIAVDDIEIVDNVLYPDKQLISVSPNPTADGSITLEWTGNAQSKLDLAMSDMMGREVYRTQIKSKGNYNKSTIQTARFAAGIYFIRVNIDGKKYNYKILYN
ncbi:MAG: T9SS type A sorting domain-containing protein [Sphingobacteriales bacterium]|nr:MAG: T9SS type A sorting domain-containing protein [Sphingobacteriales bacterium]